MFDKKKFVTNGIVENVSESIQCVLWTLLIKANKEKEELDYLQVFELSDASSDDAVIMKIKWTQEVPPREKELFVPFVKCDKPMKIWVISEGEGTEDEYATMLFPDEY